MTNESKTSARVIRVFISSTFRDMQAERDELVKRTFPQLRELCEQRSVTWAEVDLRWGLTDEQAAEGKVLPICLAEIENCRPYFICLLGERYGWVPDEISPELIEREPWLREHRAHSVTELEILHGVLNNPSMASHAFFYFRSPSFVATVPAEQRQIFSEQPVADEVARFGPVEAQRRAAERAGKLTALKARIRASGLPVRENYPTPQALGEIVLRDLTESINREFPQGAEPSPLEQDQLEHEAFARTRSVVYIPRPQYFERLDEHVKGSGPPLVLLGESGSGKSALLANWARRNSAADALVLMHFVGATPYSSDWAAMLRRFMGELKQHFAIEQEIPEQPDKLRIEFASWLRIAGSKGRIVLLIDALNQLDDRDGALNLVWLPADLPDTVRVIVSTLPGASADELGRRGCPTLIVEPLSIAERKQLVIEYLAQYRKALSPSRVERIASASQTANPLFLIVLLEELRVYGDHFSLEQRLSEYLTAQTIPALYDQVLSRYQQDYERERPRLVRDTMILLWASRRGLSEVELLELLGPGQSPLPRAFWSPLYLAADASLVSRSGLVGFAHSYLRQAVEDRYLKTTEERNAAHRRLVGYFSWQPLGPRKIDEMPWQLAEAGEWRSLFTLLADRQFFEAASDRDEFSVMSYWARVEKNSPLRITSAYTPSFSSSLDWKFLIHLISMLSNLGYANEALEIQQRLLGDVRASGDRNLLALSLGNTASLLESLGRTSEALALLQEQERISSVANDRQGSFLSLLNQAALLLDQKDLDGAEILYREAERICGTLDDKVALHQTLSGKARLSLARGDLDGALALDREAEKLRHELGDRLGVAQSIHNQAVVMTRRGEATQALALYEKAEQIFRELGRKDTLALCLLNQSRIYRENNQLERALILIEESEQLFRAVGDKAGLQQALASKGGMLAYGDYPEKALAVFQESIALSRESGDKEALVPTLNSMSVVLNQQGHRELALNAATEALQLSRELRAKELIQASLAMRANVLRDLGRLEEVMTTLEEQEKLCRAGGWKEGLALCLGTQAEIFHQWRDVERALPLYEETESLCREVGNQVYLATTLGNHALALRTQNRMDEALALHREEEFLFRQLNDTEGAQRSLDNQLLIQQWHQSHDDLAKSLEDLKETLKKFM
jgi:tetratricopeptide (TPR) repeat protein